MDCFQKVISIIDQSRDLGAKRSKNGAELIGHVPHLAPEAWLHIRFPPLTTPEIEGLESRLKRQIPKPYRRFLALSNGLSLFSDSLSLDGVRTNYSRTEFESPQPFCIEVVNLAERPRDSKPGCFYIGGYGFDGSLLYIDDNEVIRCSRASSRPLNRWGSFSEMLETEAQRLATCFDTKGRKNNPDEPTTPGRQA